MTSFAFAFQKHSIDSVFAEGKQLLDDLGCVRAEGIVEQRVGDEMLVIFD